MSDERKWASRAQLGRGSLTNYDEVRELTVYAFVTFVAESPVGLKYADHYIQAPDLEEAKSIMLDKTIESEEEPSVLEFYDIYIPSNDVLNQITIRTKH